jgi:hypothetical protein
VFAAADTDRNSVLRWAEFTSVVLFQSSSKYTMAEWFRQLQVDGAVSFRNFCLGWAHAHAKET